MDICLRAHYPPPSPAPATVTQGVIPLRSPARKYGTVQISVCSPSFSKFIATGIHEEKYSCFDPSLAINLENTPRKLFQIYSCAIFLPVCIFVMGLGKLSQAEFAE